HAGDRDGRTEVHRQALREAAVDALPVREGIYVDGVRRGEAAVRAAGHDRLALGLVAGEDRAGAAQRDRERARGRAAGDAERGGAAAAGRRREADPDGAARAGREATATRVRLDGEFGARAGDSIQGGG